MSKVESVDQPKAQLRPRTKNIEVFSDKILYFFVDLDPNDVQIIIINEYENDIICLSVKRVSNKQILHYKERVFGQDKIDLRLKIVESISKSNRKYSNCLVMRVFGVELIAYCRNGSICNPYNLCSKCKQI
jgi:hypothetical protein